jgi:hypothetical protein
MSCFDVRFSVVFAELEQRPAFATYIAFFFFSLSQSLHQFFSYIVQYIRELCIFFIFYLLGIYRETLSKLCNILKNSQASLEINLDPAVGALVGAGVCTFPDQNHAYITARA